MSDAVPATPSVCWNCRQRAAPGATRCIWCGVALNAAAAPVVATPAPAVAVPVGAAPAPAAAVPSAPAPVPSPAAHPAPAAPGGTSASAPVGPRLVAVTVDVVLLAVATTVAALFLRSPLLVAAIVAELLLLLWILDARTGATPGKALVRLRTARTGTVLSPGAGRSLARGAVHGAGLLVGVGPWLVAASASFDPWRRGWADRATGTSTLVVPPPVPAAPGLPSAPAAALLPPPPGDGRSLPPLPPSTPTLAEPRVVNVAPAHPVIEEASLEVAVPAEVFAEQQPAEQPVAAPAALPPAAPAIPAADEVAARALLLIFDTGQRVSLRTPVAVNLGRNPAATAEGDQLVTVDDPESTVSKTHARLEHSRGSTWVTDGGSTNGTEILSDEGEVTRLQPGMRVLLDEGDRVRLGNRVFTVSVVVDGGAL